MEKQRKKIWNKPSIDRFQMVCFSLDIVVRWNHISCNLFHRAFIKWTYCEKNYQNGKKMNINKAKQRCTTVMQCQFIDKSRQCWGVFFLFKHNWLPTLIHKHLLLHVWHCFMCIHLIQTVGNVCVFGSCWVSMI